MFQQQGIRILVIILTFALIVWIALLFMGSLMNQGEGAISTIPLRHTYEDGMHGIRGSVAAASCQQLHTAAREDGAGAIAIDLTLTPLVAPCGGERSLDFYVSIAAPEDAALGVTLNGKAAPVEFVPAQ